MKSLLILISSIILGLSGSSQTAFEYFNIGLVKYNLQDYAEAIADFDKAIDLNPRYAVAYNLRGASKFQISDFQGAIDDYSMAIEIGVTKQPETTTLTIYDQRGREIKQDKKARIDPELAAPYYNRALAREAIEDIAGAVEDYTLALENNPELVAVYFYRGYLKYRLDDLEGACMDWKAGEENGLAEAAALYRSYCMDEED